MNVRRTNVGRHRVLLSLASGVHDNLPEASSMTGQVFTSRKMAIEIMRWYPIIVALLQLIVVVCSKRSYVSYMYLSENTVYQLL